MAKFLLIAGIVNLLKEKCYISGEFILMPELGLVTGHIRSRVMTQRSITR